MMAPRLEHAESCIIGGDKLLGLRVLVARPGKGEVTVLALREDQDPTHQGWFDGYDPLDDDAEEDWNWMAEEIIDRLDVDAIARLPADSAASQAHPLVLRDGAWVLASSSKSVGWMRRPLERMNDARVTDLDPSKRPIPCYPTEALDPATPYVHNWEHEVRLTSDPDRALLCSPATQIPTSDCLKYIQLWRSLDHPNILPLVGLLYDRDGRIVATLTPYSPRGTLYDDESLSEPIATRLDWILQLLSAVSHVVDRAPSTTIIDISPHTLTVVSDEAGGAPYVQFRGFEGCWTEGYRDEDNETFGIARVVEEVTLPGSDGSVRTALRALVDEGKRRTIPRDLVADRM